MKDQIARIKKRPTRRAHTKPTLRSFLIDEVSLTAMLLDCVIIAKEQPYLDEDSIVRDTVQVYLDRGDVKEL